MNYMYVQCYMFTRLELLRKPFTKAGGQNSSMNLTIQKQSNLKIHVTFLALAMLKIRLR